MRIATYNVNGVNGRLPVLLRWLELRQPDVVCLQELKAPDEKFPERAIRELGYDAIWHGQKSWNGVAILSRVGEIHETRRGLPGDPDDPDQVEWLAQSRALGSSERASAELFPGDYYLVVSDEAVPTRYALCLAIGNDCTLPAPPASAP